MEVERDLSTLGLRASVESIVRRFGEHRRWCRCANRDQNRQRCYFLPVVPRDAMDVEAARIVCNAAAATCFNDL